MSRLLEEVLGCLEIHNMNLPMNWSQSIDVLATGSQAEAKKEARVKKPALQQEQKLEEDTDPCDIKLGQAHLGGARIAQNLWSSFPHGATTTYLVAKYVGGMQAPNNMDEHF